MDTENLVLSVGGRLDDFQFDIFRAGIKIYGFLPGIYVKKCVNIGIELDFQPVLKHPNALNQKLQVVAL